MQGGCVIAIYTRVSSEAQVEAESIESQRFAIRGYLASKGIPIEHTKEYADDGYSGKNLDRPQWKELNAAIDRGEHTHVIAYSLDRAGRTVVPILEWMARMNTLGVKVTFVVEGFDTTTPTGEFCLTVMLALAQLQRKQIVRNTLNGLAYRRAQGLPHGVNAKPPRPGHKGYRRFTDTEEAQIMARLEGGEPRQVVADSLGVHYRTIIKVIKRMRKKVAA